MASGRSPRRASRGRARRGVASGNRPYVLMLLALVAVVVAMAIGPLQVFSEAADRVDELEDRRDELKRDVDSLEERRERLQDPEEVEQLARSDLGMIRPGEIPFVVVPSDEDASEQALEDAEQDGVPWYRRLGRWVGNVFGGGD